ncbi:MAG: zinc-finger domain-containing protein [Burkholderiaceae bacterium]|nr:zinc-finger domain-containing protein [Burkholderiaceae bacterium]
MNETSTQPPAPADSPAADDGGAVELAAASLPACCPNPSMPIWSSHPRVFLDVAHGEEARCPYCGTRYRLRPGAARGGHH